MIDEKNATTEPEITGEELALAEETAAAQDYGTGAEGDRTAELEAQLAKAQAATLYAQAETQNVRRRLEKDAADARVYAATGFARDMLSVADNFARALDVMPPELREDDRLKGLVGGIEATNRELARVFERHGITRITAVGEKLDPNKHQAMMEVPSDQEPGTIVQEMQAGYMIKDRLLRAAMVGVARAG